MKNQNVLSKEITNKLSFFRWGFILIVVLFHSDFRFFYPFIEDLTAVSTAYFFCASAFFFYRGLSNENIAERLRKRCFTLLLPYFLWNIIYIILYLKIYNFTFSSVLQGFTITPFCTPSWYLLTLFIFFIPAGLIKRALSKAYSTVILLIFGVIISYLGYIRFQQELATIPAVGGYLVRMAEYLTSYLIGGIMGTWFDKKIYVTWKECWIGAISSCTVIFLLKWDIPVEMRWLLWMIFPLILWKAVPETIFGNVRISCLFTEPFFWINMSHCYLLFAWGTITTKMGFVTGKYLVALNLILTLAVSYALYYLLKLFIPKVLQILTGNRI